VSIEAISWVLNHAPIPTDRKDASSLTVVLIGLANHTDRYGRHAFPSVQTLADYSRLSTRSVMRAVAALHELGLITEGNYAIVAAHIPDPRHRPRIWDLRMPPAPVDNSAGRGDNLSKTDGGRGDRNAGSGVTATSSRDDRLSDKPSFNRPRNRPPRPSAPRGRSAVPPECGQCDARPGDPVSARIVWLDDDHTHSVPCPRCHPHAARTGASR
jgi:hypothetical protein